MPIEHDAPAEPEPERLGVTPEQYVRSLLRQYGPMPIHKLWAVTRAVPYEASGKARYVGAPSHIIQSLRHLKVVLRKSAESDRVAKITTKRLRAMADAVGVADGTDRINSLTLPAAIPGSGTYVWLDGESMRRLSALGHQLKDGEREGPADKAWLQAPRPPSAPLSSPDKPPPSPWDFTDEEQAAFFANLRLGEQDDVDIFAQDPVLGRTVSADQTVSDLKLEAKMAARAAKARTRGGPIPLLPSPTSTERYIGRVEPPSPATVRQRIRRSLKGARVLPLDARQRAARSAS